MTRWTGAAAAVALACVLVWPPAAAYASGSRTFGYTGGEQDWTVPAGVTSVTIEASGAQGGNGYGGGYGGGGGSATATISVTPGETLAVFVGGRGADGDGVDISAGGFNGGADGASGGGGSGGGGGASDVRQGGTALGDRVLVAGGGGGGGSDTYAPSGGGEGGAGGGTTGVTGNSGTWSDGIGDDILGGYGGEGGSQAAGGGGGTDYDGFSSPAASGSSGSGGAGSGYGSVYGAGGGGGGGYFGGGGGGPSNYDFDFGRVYGGGGGGGGGSSFAEADALGVSLTQGGHAGDGQVVITYAVPPPHSPAGFTGAAGSPFAAGGGPSSVAVGDLNGDGHPDLAIADWNSGQVTVLLGDGSGGFTAAPGSPFAAGINPNSIAIGDFNGDGHPDLAVANYNSNDVTVLLGDGSGGFSPAPSSPFAAGTNPYAVAIGDLNGDGYPDIAVADAGSNDVTVLLGNGSGGFNPAPSSPFAAGSSPTSVAIGDLNGDGHLDLAVADGGGGVTVLLGDGSGGFSAAAGSPFAAGSGPRAIAIGDLNGDGNPDLAVANAGSNDVTVLLGDGSGGFTPAAGSPFATGASPNAVAIGDLNGDGNPDLAFADNGSNDATLLLGDGSGGFTAAIGSPFAAGTGPNGIAIGDLDGDGHLDLAVANYGSSDATVLFQIAAPGAPTDVSATAGDGQATVSWSAARDGHAAIDNYTVTAVPGGAGCFTGGAGRNCIVTGLTNGTPYTFTVTATNNIGIGPASSPSAPVTPQSPDAPAVIGFTPDSGGARATVTVTGTNFNGATAVKVNGTSAAFSVVSATKIVLTVPATATTGPIAVTNASGTGTSAAGFTVLGAPVITNVSPGSGPVGTPVTITGQNLDSVVAVRLGDIVTVPTSDDGTHVVFNVPPGAVSGLVEVLATSGSATSAAVFTVTS